VELARGIVGDERPWALTLAMFARRGTTGQLTLASADGKRYSIALDRGVVVAARSPSIADSVSRIALTTRIATSDQLTDLARRHQAAPHRDEIELLADIAKLSPSHEGRLRWEVTARRAARSFCVERGEWLLESKICLPVGGCEVDPRAVVFQGLRLHASEDQVRRQLRMLGEVYQLEGNAGPELHRFGFTDDEWPLMAAMRVPSTLPELEAQLREIDPRAMNAAVFALVVFGTASTPAIGRIATPPSLSRLGTPQDIVIGRVSTRQQPANLPSLSASRHTPAPIRIGPPPGVPSLPALPRTKTNPEMAAEAVERATRALDQDKPEAAVLELKKAVELVPNDPDYTALLGWALFCAADDKRAAATIARKALEAAIGKSKNPHVARFFLGRIERILGRHQEALGHFHAVLLMQPNHREASAEIRILQARLRSTD
jgi:hypothetical protein